MFVSSKQVFTRDVNDKFKRKELAILMKRSDGDTDRFDGLTNSTGTYSPRNADSMHSGGSEAARNKDSNHSGGIEAVRTMDSTHNSGGIEAVRTTDSTHSNGSCSISDTSFSKNSSNSEVSSSESVGS